MTSGLNSFIDTLYDNIHLVLKNNSGTGLLLSISSN